MTSVADINALIALHMDDEERHHMPDADRLPPPITIGNGTALPTKGTELVTKLIVVGNDFTVPSITVYPYLSVLEVRVGHGITLDFSRFPDELLRQIRTLRIIELWGEQPQLIHAIRRMSSLEKVVVGRFASKIMTQLQQEFDDYEYTQVTHVEQRWVHNDDARTNQIINREYVEHLKLTYIHFPGHAIHGVGCITDLPRDLVSFELDVHDLNDPTYKDALRFIEWHRYQRLKTLKVPHNTIESLPPSVEVLHAQLSLHQCRWWADRLLKIPDLRITLTGAETRDNVEAIMKEIPHAKFNTDRVIFLGDYDMM